MTWLQLAVVCLKFLIYIDSADIEELNQAGGSASVKIQLNQKVVFPKQSKKVEMNLKMT